MQILFNIFRRESVANRGIHKLNNLYIQVRLKKRRKPYLRYLWLNLSKTKTGINHFKHSISITLTFFQKVIQGQMIVNIIFSNSFVSIFFYSYFERDYFSESNDMPVVRMRLIVTEKINK
jgi:hypothetical protein